VSTVVALAAVIFILFLYYRSKRQSEEHEIQMQLQLPGNIICEGSTYSGDNNNQSTTDEPLMEEAGHTPGDIPYLILDICR